MFQSRKSLIEALAKIAVTPYNLHVPREPEVVFRKKDDEQPVPFADKVPVARRVYMKPEDFTTFWWTVGCPRCDFDRKYGVGRTSKPHSNTCRDRIMAGLAETPEGRERIARATERLHRYVHELGGGDANDGPGRV